MQDTHPDARKRLERRFPDMQAGFRQLNTFEIAPMILDQRLRRHVAAWMVGGLTLAGSASAGETVRLVVAQAGPTAVEPALQPVLAQAGPALIQADEAEKIPAPAAQAAPATKGAGLTLAECLRLASEKQPSLAAHRASLAAAQTGLRALENLRGPAVLASPDIPIRRQQACLGVEIAEANLRQAELENANSVTRLYLTVLYAREQTVVAQEVVDSFRGVQKQVKEGVESGQGPRDWTQSTVDKLTIYLRMAESRRAEAQLGTERALGALREAIGLCPDAPLDVPQGPLPEGNGTASRAEIVAMALALRPEVQQAAKGETVFLLEVDAQGKTLLPAKVATFAAGSDLHAKPIPASSTQGEYRPGALAPEMPTLLVGKRCDRMERARDYATRACHLTEKVRNLIALEAEDAYLQWHRSKERVASLKEARDAGVRLAQNTREDFRAAQKVKIEDLLANEVLAAQARSQYNEVLFGYLTNLAALERVTAGGFCAGLGK